MNGRQRGHGAISGPDCSGTGYSKVEWSDMVLFLQRYFSAIFPGNEFACKPYSKNQKTMDKYLSLYNMSAVSS